MTNCKNKFQNKPKTAGRSGPVILWCLGFMIMSFAANAQSAQNTAPDPELECLLRTQKIQPGQCDQQDWLRELAASCSRYFDREYNGFLKKTSSDLAQKCADPSAKTAPKSTPEQTKQPAGSVFTRTAGPSERESRIWTVIKELEDVDATELYLRKFPNGFYSKDAKRLLKKLSGIAAAKEAPPQQKTVKQTAEAGKLAARIVHLEAVGQACEPSKIRQAIKAEYGREKPILAAKDRLWGILDRLRAGELSMRKQCLPFCVIPVLVTGIHSSHLAKTVAIAGLLTGRGMDPCDKHRDDAETW